jgi:hypothetical protein
MCVDPLPFLAYTGTKDMEPEDHQERGSCSKEEDGVVLGDCIAVGGRQEVASPERGTNELVVYSPLNDDGFEPPQLSWNADWAGLVCHIVAIGDVN